jgi:hypothetical protein
VLNGKRLELVTGARDGEAVIGEAKMPEFTDLLCFEAPNPRRERTGVHTELRILVGDGPPLAYSTINISRHEDRTKLANLAADNYGDKTLGKAIRLRLDYFCSQLWEWWTSGYGSEWNESTDIPDLSFLLHPYVLGEAGTIVFGYKGQGKSWLGIIWTVMLHHGLSGRWKVERPRPAMFVNLERGRDSVERRRAMVSQALGVRGWRALHRRGHSLVDVYDELRREIDRHGIEVVVIDSISRTGAGKLTTDEDTNRAMDLLNRLGCSWVALGHSPRASAEHLYGNVMQENAADVVIQLVGERSSLHPLTIGSRLRVKAANDLPPVSPEVYALEFGEKGMEDLRDPKPGEFPELMVDVGTPSDRIVEFISLEGPASAAALCEGTDLARSTVYEALKSPRFVRTLSGGGRGNKTLWGLRTVSGLDDESAG